MAILPIRTLGDPVLRERGRDVERFDASLRRLFRDMLETMYDAPGVGLAAPQVGLSLRFFVYDAGDGQGSGAVANPELTVTDGYLEQEEGCLSIPGVFHPTRRFARARLRGQDVDGNAVTLEGEGLLARILQHETDHLNGMLFMDRLDEAGRRRVMAEFRQMELEGGERSRSRRRPAGR